MKDIFPEFYKPKDEDIENAWRNGTIVFDTNVLLGLYRMPAIARKEFLTTMTLVQDRIWVPFHVAMEFQLGRLSAAKYGNTLVNDQCEKAAGTLVELEKTLHELKIDRRGIASDLKVFDQKLLDLKDLLGRALQELKETLPNLGGSDEIRDELDKILSGRVGPRPNSQKEVSDLIAKGDERYKSLIPPGFEDKAKGDDLVFDGLLYPRKFGDLILWRQIINYAREKKIEHIIFITDDNKDDWWSKSESGSSKIGPHIELINEIKREAGVKGFAMHSSNLFLEGAKKYLHAKASEDTLKEVKEVAQNSTDADAGIQNFSWSEYFGVKRGSQFGDALGESVRDWLISNLGETLIEISTKFPAFWYVYGDNASQKPIFLLDLRKKSELSIIRSVRAIDKEASVFDSDEKNYQSLIVVAGFQNYAKITQDYPEIRKIFRKYQVIVGEEHNDKFKAILWAGEPDEVMERLRR